MARLRAPACDTVSATEAFRTEAASVAAAGAGVTLSAICAMKVPRPTRIAAKINMLRIAPHPIRGFAITSCRREKFDRRCRARPAILPKRMSEALTGRPTFILAKEGGLWTSQTRMLTLFRLIVLGVELLPASPTLPATSRKAGLLKAGLRVSWVRAGGLSPA